MSKRDGASNAPERARIGSLRLKLPAASAAQATQLARAIGLGLAARSTELGTQSAETLRVQVPSRVADGSEALVGEIVQRVLAASRGASR
jgi:hypothetical protein